MFDRRLPRILKNNGLAKVSIGNGRPRLVLSQDIEHSDMVGIHCNPLHAGKLCYQPSRKLRSFKVLV